MKAMTDAHDSLVTFFRSHVISLVTLIVFCFASPARADGWDFKLPAGTRTVDGQLVSARGLRDTTDAIARELDRRGIAMQQIGPYRVRAVELTRFVSLTPSTPWLAIHVSRSAGRTVIAFVARPGAVPP